ncbi:MAG: FtsH protease activity modulator HflK [Buchnera aphidicola (Pentalonia nigronervosa)]|jgi:membrane protease subunit HflK|uniref:Protein HflK n=1 Tax=Buchnera aphidicola (Pentalonia nigronervosa) TaxID=1309793 RepID=A0A7H1AZ29_9GAMM|nr:MAG: FtsH protease activity modulator HflK [Buchnera aphidicola (Pentalonia nigronervosa)]
MAWNKPNHNQPKLDPWGNKNSNDQNSEENKNNKQKKNKNIILDVKKFLYNIGNTVHKKNNSLHASKKSVHPFLTIIFIGLLVLCLSGFYTIKETERGVITSFGKFSHVVKPGLNWRPIFINKVTPVNIETVRELATSGVMLTADENVVHVEMNVQYKIINPVDYLFSVFYPDDSLRQATDSALRGVIGRSTMDRVLTEGRTLVRNDTQKEIENIIKPYKMGIAILDVNFQTARPPEQVKSAFDDAIAARENREQYIHEAESYLNEVCPHAHGQAQRILEEARAYSSRIVLEAQGEVVRFSKILPQYKINKNITLHRFYIESMERLFKHNKKIFIDKKSNTMLFLSLNDFLKKNKLINKKNKNDIQFKKDHIFSPKNKINIDYSSSLLSKNNVFKQRHINSIRNDIKNIERK